MNSEQTELCRQVWKRSAVMLSATVKPKLSAAVREAPGDRMGLTGKDILQLTGGTGSRSGLFLLLRSVHSAHGHVTALELVSFPCTKTDRS